MLDVKPEPTVAMLAASLLCAAGAQANDSSDKLIATIDEVTGSVFVDNGQSYLPAQAGTSLEAYDRVFVLEDGSAAFVFEDGCRVAVAGPATRTLGPETSCDSMQAAAPTSLDQVVTDAASSPQALTLERAGTSRLTEYQIGAGIFGAMTLGGVIWAATNDDDDNPSRPPQLSP